MNLYQLRSTVHNANTALNDSGLVLFTFGNVSGVDRQTGVMVIKPSGVPYDELTPDNMVCVSLETGEVIDSELNPSSDTPTHLEIYRAFPSVGGVVHSHSPAATACAQARVPIRCMGTTQADYFYGDVPVTRPLTREETENDYEANTGKVIVEAFRSADPERMPAALVAYHGPFVWGRDPAAAVYHAVILEQLATMERDVRRLNPRAVPPPQYLIDRHYFRKHGPGAYYGQGER